MAQLEFTCEPTRLDTGRFIPERSIPCFNGDRPRLMFTMPRKALRRSPPSSPLRPLQLCVSSYREIYQYAESCSDADTRENHSSLILQSIQVNLVKEWAYSVLCLFQTHGPEPGVTALVCKVTTHYVVRTLLSPNTRAAGNYTQTNSSQQ